MHLCWYIACERETIPSLQYVWDYAKELSTEEQFSSFVHHMELCAQEHQSKQLIKTVWSVKKRRHLHIMFRTLHTG